MKKILVFAAACCFSVLMSAQEAKLTDGHESSQEILSIQTAAALVQYGYHNDSPTALIEAARIIGTTNVQEGDMTGVSDASQADSAEKEERISYDPARLLADAQKMAGKDEEIASLIKRTEKEIKEFAKSTRGVVGGAEVLTDRVESYSNKVYTARFWGGELAEVLVVGDGDTDLDLYIYDQNGNLIDSDTDTSDNCYCCWVPARTSVYVIQIRNLGGVYNRYTLLTN